MCAYIWFKQLVIRYIVHVIMGLMRLVRVVDTRAKTERKIGYKWISTKDVCVMYTHVILLCTRAKDKSRKAFT